MGMKSERIAELEKEKAEHDKQRCILHEENLSLQETIQGLRREVVLRTQETRDFQNSRYLLWKECNALQATVRSLTQAKENALNASGVPTVVKYVHSLEGNVKWLESELIESRKRVGELERYNNQLEYRNYLFGLLKATARPLDEGWRGYLAQQLSKMWTSKGFAEHVRRESTLRTHNFNKPKF
jgi:chromosome segregation ATPase